MRSKLSQYFNVTKSQSYTQLQEYQVATAISEKAEKGYANGFLVF